MMEGGRSCPSSPQRSNILGGHWMVIFSRLSGYYCYLDPFLLHNPTDVYSKVSFIVVNGIYSQVRVQKIAVLGPNPKLFQCLEKQQHQNGRCCVLWG